MAIRVFLLDDHEVVRQGIRSLLEAEGIDVVGEAGTAAEALSRIGAMKPNVAVLDVRLPDGNGVEVCRDIRAIHPEIACIMLTSYSDDEALLESVLAGSAGYVLKEIRGRDLIEGIRTVAAGGLLFDPTSTRKLMDELQRSHVDHEGIQKLSKRESEILELIAEGKTNREIGAELFLAEKTVKNYVSNLLAKLGMGRRSEAAAYAARLQERKSGNSRHRP